MESAFSARSPVLLMGMGFSNSDLNPPCSHCFGPYPFIKAGDVHANTPPVLAPVELQYRGLLLTSKWHFKNYYIISTESNY